MIVHHIAMAFVFIPMILVRRDHEPGKAFGVIQNVFNYEKS